MLFVTEILKTLVEKLKNNRHDYYNSRRSCNAWILMGK